MGRVHCMEINAVEWAWSPGRTLLTHLLTLLYYSQIENERQWINDTGGGFCSADAGLGDQHSLPSPADDAGLSLYFLSGLSQLRRWAANFFFKARAISAAGSEQSNSTGSRCTRNGVPPGDLQQLCVTVSAASAVLATKLVPAASCTRIPSWIDELISSKTSWLHMISCKCKDLGHYIRYH